VTPSTLYEVAAPAKLNLFLHVIGRRADGYHLLQSLFLLIDWADTLHFERRADGRVARHDLGPALPEDDLCMRAARALQSVSSTPWGVDISIDKKVPWGAGMGGGSSDAASTLLALNRLWNLHWPRDRLMALATSLGADVPFFVGGNNAFVEGIGERLSPATVPRQWLGVVKPPQSIETQDVFKSRLLVRDTAPVILSGSFAGAGVPRVISVEDISEGFGRNDLQPVAQDLCPAVVDAARRLEQRFGNSRMTGSGSAVFARAGAGDLPTATLPALPPGWAGRMCRSLEAHPLRDWVAG
jgi:4-diphosphocytidyl-2-C-methyl-D-erythritol kinase